MATLKISDLSVGDWVYVKWKSDDKWQGQIVAISCTESLEVRLLDDIPFKARCTIEFVEPIPITPEILEANGFGQKTYTQDQLLRIVEPNGNRPFIGYRWDSRRLIIGRNNDYMLRVKAEYIQQLQHALRLAGVEREIVMPNK